MISSVPFLEAVDVSGATIDLSDPTSCWGAAYSVWYEFTPAVTATYFFSADSSSYNAAVKIYTGSCGSLTRVACSSNGVSATLTAGTTYKIMIVSRDRFPGILVMRVCTPPAAPVITIGTVCPGSAANVASTPDAGGGMAYKWRISNGTITSGQGTPSITFTIDPSVMNDDAGSISVTATAPDGCFATGSTRIAIGGETLIAAAAVAANSTGNTAYVQTVTGASAGLNYTWSITDGTITTQNGSEITYTAGPSGSVGLSVTSMPAGCQNGATATTTVPIATVTPTSDGCASPKVISSLPTRDFEDLSTATVDTDASASCFLNNPLPNSVWYQYTPQTDQVFTVHTVGSSNDTAIQEFDTAMAVFTGSCGSLTQVGCNYDLDHAGPWVNQSAVTVNGVAGSTYHIAVGMEWGIAFQSIAATSFHAGPIGTVAVTTPTSGCLGVQYTATVPDAGSGAQYFWGASGARIVGGSSTNTSTFILTDVPLAMIGVYVVDGLGYLSRGTAVVNVNGSAAIAAPPFVASNGSDTASASATPGATYSWAIQNGMLTSAANQPSVTFTAGSSGVTRLTVSVSGAGCSTQTGVRDVTIVPASNFNSCTYDVVPAFATLPSGSAVGSIQVFTASNCSWTATPSANASTPLPCVFITGGASGTGNGTVSYSVCSNPYPAPRAFAIEIGGKSFSVTQNAAANAPFVLTATGSANQVALSWPAVPGATTYMVARSSYGRPYSTIANVTTTSFNDVSVANGTAYLYRVAALGIPDVIAYSTVDLAVPFSFTDPSLVSGTLIKAAHFTELRSALNAARAALGWTPYSFGAAIAPGTIISASHLQELRWVLDTIRAGAALQPMAYTNPTIAAGMLIRAVDVTDVRSGVQ